MNSREISGGEAVQEYLTGITAELNLRLLCESEDGQMLWVESITVTDCEMPPQTDKGMTEGGKQKPGRIVSLWKQIRQSLMGRKGKGKNRTDSP